MATFGNRPEDAVTDKAGNVRPDVVITVYASEADATAQRNSLGSASSGADGRWPLDVDDVAMVWAREPKGSIWAVASETAISDHETRLTTVEDALPDKLEAADIADKADVTYVDDGLADKLDSATAATTYGTKTQQDTNTTAIANRVTKGTVVLDVADYGALGDGSTDDTTSIQTALTAARTAKGRLRLRPNKTYIVSALLNPVGVILDGQGSTIKIKSSTTQSYNLFQGAGAFTINNLVIDLNKANTTDPGSNAQGAGVWMSASTFAGGVLRDVTVQNGWQVGIRISSTTGVTDALNASVTKAVIDSCVVTNTKYGIWMSNCWGVTILNPQISSTTAEGIYDNLSRDTHVIGGTVQGAGGHGFFSQYGHGTVVDGLSVSGCTLSGITFGGGSTTSTEGRNYTITGCTARANTLHGITLDPTKSGASGTNVSVYAAVTGNVCDGNGTHGINLQNSEGVAVTGNVCKDNTGSGIGVSAAGAAISGNVCTGNARGIALFGNSTFTNYGSHRVGMNVVSDNSTDAYYVESASVTDLLFASSSSTAPTS